MGSQVPVWIPIVVALLGLAGVMLTQVLSGRREARRMAEEAAREERRWQREREARTHEARADAYAELLGALGAFDAVLFRALRSRETGHPIDEYQVTELREVRSETQHALGPVSAAQVGLSSGEAMAPGCGHRPDRRRRSHILGRVRSWVPRSRCGFRSSSRSSASPG